MSLEHFQSILRDYRVFILIASVILAILSIISMAMEKSPSRRSATDINIAQVIVTLLIPSIYLYSLFGRKSYIHYTIRAIILWMLCVGMLIFAFISKSETCRSECFLGGSFTAGFIFACLFYSVFVFVETCCTVGFKFRANRRGFKNVDVNISIVEPDNTIVPLEQYTVQVDELKQ